MKPTRAWAWSIDVDGRRELCLWAAPTLEDLKRGGKPSPEAKAHSVLISLNRRRKLKKRRSHEET